MNKESKQKADYNKITASQSEINIAPSSDERKVKNCYYVVREKKRKKNENLLNEHEYYMLYDIFRTENQKNAAEKCINESSDICKIDNENINNVCVNDCIQGKEFGQTDHCETKLKIDALKRKDEVVGGENQANTIKNCVDKFDKEIKINKEGLECVYEHDFERGKGLGNKNKLCGVIKINNEDIKNIYEDVLGQERNLKYVNKANSVFKINNEELGGVRGNDYERGNVSGQRDQNEIMLKSNEAKQEHRIGANNKNYGRDTLKRECLEDKRRHTQYRDSTDWKRRKKKMPYARAFKCAKKGIKPNVNNNDNLKNIYLCNSCNKCNSICLWNGTDINQDGNVIGEEKCTVLKKPYDKKSLIYRTNTGTRVFDQSSRQTETKDFTSLPSVCCIPAECKHSYITGMNKILCDKNDKANAGNKQ